MTQAFGCIDGYSHNISVTKISIHCAYRLCAIVKALLRMLNVSGVVVFRIAMQKYL